MTATTEVERIVAAGTKSEEEMSKLPKELSPEEMAKEKHVLLMKFKDKEDLELRFPYMDELEEEDSVYSWHNKVIVTQDLMQDVLKHVYSEFPSSIGRIKLYYYLRERYWGLSQPAVQTFLNGEESHQVHRVRYRSQVSRSIIPDRTGHTLMCDCSLIARQGQKGLLTVMDLFSKRVDCAMFRTQSAASIAEKFERLLEGFKGEHKVLRSDNGTEFKGEFDEMLQRLGIKHIRSQAHSPTSQGAVERMNYTVKKLITSSSGEQGRDFGPNLRKAINTINSTIHTVTQFTPNSLNSADVPANIRLLVRQRLRTAADGTRPNDRMQPELEPGDVVRLWNGEMQTQEMGLPAGVAANKWKKAIKNHDSTYKASHEKQFTTKTFTVQRHILTSNLVILNEYPDKKFPRGNVLKVPVAQDD